MNLSTLKPSDLETWARVNRSLARTVCEARAFAEIERERVDAYVVPIFVRYGFTDEDDGAPLKDPRRAYLAGDAPGVEARMADYYAECDEAHRAHGFTGETGHCPALVAEDLQRQAEQILLGSLAALLGMDDHAFSRTLEIRAKALDLALATCLSRRIAKGAQ